LEGIVSKRLTSIYRSGPSRAWLKIKNQKAPAAARAGQLKQLMAAPTSLLGKLPLGAALSCRYFNTLASERMSALGQKQTYAVQQAMSALPPIATVKADSRRRSAKRS